MSNRSKYEYAAQMVDEVHPVLWVCKIGAIIYLIGFLIFNVQYPEAVDFEKFLFFMHFIASIGFDEGAVLMYTMCRQGRPDLSIPGRNLIPGRPVTPALSFLPKHSSLFSCFTYASYLILSTMYFLDRIHVISPLIAFALASIFDAGLFFSTRPFDILKLLLASLKSKRLIIQLCGFLYMASGASKWGGYFWNWTFPFHFLGYSPISSLLRPFYLDSNKKPTTLTKFIGFNGCIGEVLAGFLLVFPATYEAGALLLLGMHLFIFIFGCGPHRWNVMQIFVLWRCYGFQHDQLDSFDWVVILIFGVSFPLAGLFAPEFAGRYCGGFRGASFHFTGNEYNQLFFIPKKNAPKSFKQFDESFLDFSAAADGVDTKLAKEKLIELGLHPADWMGLCSYFIEVFIVSLNTKVDGGLMAVRDRQIEYLQETYKVDEIYYIEAVPVLWWDTNKKLEIKKVHNGKTVLLASMNVKMDWTIYADRKLD